jgi:hypothetical protein
MEQTWTKYKGDNAKGLREPGKRDGLAGSISSSSP